MCMCMYLVIVASFKVSSTGDIGIVTPLYRWSNWGTERWHSLPASLFLPESGMKTNLPSKNQPGCVSPPDKYLQDAGSVSNQQPTLSCLTTQSLSYVTWLFSSRNASNLPLNLQYGFFSHSKKTPKFSRGKATLTLSLAPSFFPQTLFQLQRLRGRSSHLQGRPWQTTSSSDPFPSCQVLGQWSWPSPTILNRVKSSSSTTTYPLTQTSFVPYFFAFISPSCFKWNIFQPKPSGIGRISEHFCNPNLAFVKSSPYSG